MLKMRYPKLRELKEAIKALIKGPYTTSFPFKPHKPYDRFRGKSEFHEKDCVGCGACFQVCPARAIDMRDEEDVRVLSVRWDLCIFCGQCQANCLTGKGIMLSQEFDLAAVKRQGLKQEIKKELLRCGACHQVIAPHDQIEWVLKRLGPLVFSNASLMVFYLNGMGLALADKELNIKSVEGRASRLKIICPACRRKAVLES